MATQTPKASSPGFAFSTGRNASRKVRYVEYSEAGQGCPMCRPMLADSDKKMPLEQEGPKQDDEKESRD
ncbi:hypothetical protein [Shewanella litorisediminis]|uniref:Uncharacterized protein n=1 Tax=Shewanella litorisediminis TaxID=1173586 RepID=A0ABX7G2U8_9GAMM|nr:hypothetical protein [Shewanella litorisediminis]MCL2917132.1 hypothetical protein [Shewanella litorisediminis]QRH01609.1 hypothetical protein JQC75_17470 [Shewanella litorisediminis]